VCACARVAAQENRKLQRKNEELQKEMQATEVRATATARWRTARSLTIWSMDARRNEWT
jgi:hypothetical protein